QGVSSRAPPASIRWTRNFSSNVLYQLRLGYLRRNSNFTSTDAAKGIPAGFTLVDPMTAAFGAGAGLPQFFTENQYQVKDDLSMTKGRHNWKYGFEYRRTQNASKFFNDLNGTVAPWSVEDLLSDLTFSDQLDNFFFGGPVIGSCA